MAATCARPAQAPVAPPAFDLEEATIADLQRLPDILRSRGYSTADISGILHGNLLRFLRSALP